MKTSELYQLFLEYPLISTDTRHIAPNSIFFALKGANFNGNDFAEAALKAGAAYCVVDEPRDNHTEKCIMVKDVLLMLQYLANHHIIQLDIPVLALTGTNGKTTTKELIREVLATTYNVTATEGNLNNHIGVPLTLLKCTTDTEIAVIEIGANHIGEIAALCKIAEPKYGLITNIGKAHLEGFGSYEGVITAKTELYEYIRKADGTLFVNADDKLLVKECPIDTDVYTYGKDEDNDVAASDIDSTEFLTLMYKGNEVKTNLVGAYNKNNVMAAMAIGQYFEVPENELLSAISNYAPTNNRSQRIEKGSNTIVMDAYNANPSSMSVAIENFAKQKNDNKILILGDMFELGIYANEEHTHIARLAQKYPLKKVYFVGNAFKAIAKDITPKNDTIFLSTTAELLEILKSNAITNGLILIKGSRGMKLEMALEAI